MLTAYVYNLQKQHAPTFNFQGGSGPGGGDLIGVFSNISGSGDDDNEPSHSAVLLTHDVFTIIDGLTIFQPLSFS